MSLFPEIERRMKIRDAYGRWRKRWIPPRWRPFLFRRLAYRRVSKELSNGSR